LDIGDYLDAKKNRELVKVYREAFGWNGKPGDAQGRFLDDLQNFCGLNQARFSGDQHEMVKQLGRIEVLGRINFFMNMSQKDIEQLDEIIKEWETDDGTE